jgi:hypothetical protein
MTENEQKVVEILTSYPPTDDLWKEPIQGVDRVMSWDTARTKAFVQDLVERGLVAWRTEAINEPNGAGQPLSWWVQAQR